MYIFTKTLQLNLKLCSIYLSLNYHHPTDRTLAGLHVTLNQTYTGRQETRGSKRPAKLYPSTQETRESTCPTKLAYPSRQDTRHSILFYDLFTLVKLIPLNEMCFELLLKHSKRTRFSQAQWNIIPYNASHIRC